MKAFSLHDRNIRLWNGYITIQDVPLFDLDQLIIERREDVPLLDLDQLIIERRQQLQTTSQNLWWQICVNSCLQNQDVWHLAVKQEASHYYKNCRFSHGIYILDNSVEPEIHDMYLHESNQNYNPQEGSKSHL